MHALCRVASAVVVTERVPHAGPELRYGVVDMLMPRARFALVALVAFSFVGACSSSGSDARDPASTDAGISTTDASEVDASSGDAGATTADADAGSTPLPAVTGSLEAKAAGGLPTTVAPGVIALGGGRAQWRPRPSGGGVLTIFVAEAAPGTRAFELTISDDAGNVDADESFAAAPATSLPFRSSRVETYGAKAWTTNGDGTVVVKSLSTSAVTVELKNVGQFVQAPASGDTWILAGTVTVPIVALAPTTASASTVTPSNGQPEPITSEPLNLTTTAAMTGAVRLADESYPFSNARRAASIADGSGATARRVLVGFPTGHLPHEGQSIPLNTFDRVTLTLVEGTTFTGDAAEKVWEADQGTIAVQSRTATSLVLSIQTARMQSESPAAKGIFDLSGTVTIALP